jgi:hypothetical protein
MQTVGTTSENVSRTVGANQSALPPRPKYSSQPEESTIFIARDLPSLAVGPDNSSEHSIHALPFSIDAKLQSN